MAPAWGRVPAFALALVCVLFAPVRAQPKKPDKTVAPSPAEAAKPVDKAQDGARQRTLPSGASEAAKKKQATKTFDFTALDLNGRMRSPQLLYFLERANEELERASLEKRSFIPHMVRSIEEEQL